MPYKEKEIEKLYYTIGEVAQMFNVNTSHIRFWSKEFDVIRPATNKKGNRLYTQSDLENFKRIYHLVKEKGFTLKGAKSELKDSKTKIRVPETTGTTMELSDNPVEIPFPQSSTQEAQDAFVDRIAIKNSLQKMKSSLLDIQKALVLMEEA
jgi:DNA-binding transcriptional MerR regulator